MIGNVKWYNASKGYGFIKTEDREVFFHRSQLKQSVKALAQGDNVEFELYEVGENRYEARNIERA